MGNVQQKGREDGLTQFQRRKLKYEFCTFFDLNNDGCLTYNDFQWAKDKICYMSGWKIDNPKYKITEALFKEIWESLVAIADIDKDGKITKTEWLMMWTSYKKEIIAREKQEKDFLLKFFDQHKDFHSKNDEAVSAVIPKISKVEKSKTEVKPVPSQEKPQQSRDESDDWDIELDSDEEPPPFVKKRPKNDPCNDEKTPPGSETPSIHPESKPEESETVLEIFSSENKSFLVESSLPKWLFKYLVFRFFLLDRTGDNVIDNEEFEYVLSEFGVREKIARQAFTIFTQNNTVQLDFDYFVKLFEQYYLSNDPADLGNFINGKLDFDEESDDEDPGLLDHKFVSTTSIHSMDEDINNIAKANLDRNRPSHKSTIKLHESNNKLGKVYKEVKHKCCCVS